MPTEIVFSVRYELKPKKQLTKHANGDCSLWGTSWSRRNSWLHMPTELCSLWGTSWSRRNSWLNMPTENVFSVRYELKPKKQLTEHADWDFVLCEVRAEAEETVDWTRQLRLCSLLRMIWSRRNSWLNMPTETVFSVRYELRPKKQLKF